MLSRDVFVDRRGGEEMMMIFILVGIRGGCREFHEFACGRRFHALQIGRRSRGVAG